MKRPTNRMISGIFLLILSSLCIVSCKKDDDWSNSPEAVLARNQFVESLLTDTYYWNEETKSKIMSNSLTANGTTDPFEYFAKLLYFLDPWSYLIDDMATNNEQSSGTMTTFGYALNYYWYEGDNQNRYIYALVKFVYPGSPAEKAGLKRGDIIREINGSAIPYENYRNLFNVSSINLTVDIGRSISMNAVYMYEDPIVYQDIIEKGGKKIGYLFYTDYLMGSLDDSYRPLRDLTDVFTRFKNESVDEVILDLRYNSGGSSLATNFLSHLLAPRTAIDNQDILRINVWNNKYRNDTVRFTHPFTITSNNQTTEIPLTANMDLERLYVLTSNRSASASEVTIMSLMPYLEVIPIGTATRGKSFGGPKTSAGQFQEEYKDNRYLDNWGAYILHYRFTNKDNYIFYPGGIPAQYEVTENLYATYEIGDEKDPLLAKALAVITGIEEDADDNSRSITRNGPTMHEIKNGPDRMNNLDGKLID